jgi:excinuclease ABC subunit C
MHITLSDILNTLPQKPGVYRFYDKEQHLLYVGKAINLKKRVNSYFTKKHDSRRLNLLVSQIDSIKFTVVKDERDAFLLENNLIKNEKPKYNILLKDDKTYPYIAIKNEPFPRVYFTRNKINDGSEFFGPFTSQIYAKKALEVILKIFQVRSCKLNLTEKNINQNKFKVCLEYHIGNCLGPCEKHQNEKDYSETITQIRNILSGKSDIATQYLQEKVNEFSNNLEFEKAFDYTKRIEILQNYNKKNTIAHTGTRNLDVYHILKADTKFFVQFLRVKNGAIISAKNFEQNSKLDETEEDILCFVIENNKHEFNEGKYPAEILGPINIDRDEIKMIVPAQGERKKLLDLAFRNIVAQKQHYFELKKKKDEKPTAQVRVMQKLQEDLKLKELPDYIECFDNSNIQGTNPVASMVVFRNAKPANKDYRHYKIKTVEGPDDFASMEEVVFRRYSRLLKENQELPKLIVIDGGKGQLSAAIKSLKELGIYHKIPIIGIAKRLEEIYFPEDPYPLYINKKSESLKVIQNIRNEAHRFAINFHRNLRSKDFTKTSIENIRGIGKKTTELLIKEFGSIEKIKQASLKELALFIGQSKAKILLDSLS